MAASPTVAVVLNWNRKEVTLRCVEALRRARPAPPAIVLVDNGSTDGSPAFLREACPDVDLIEAGANLGYAGGNNLGIKRALGHGAARVLILNNDVEVEPDCIARLETALDRDPAVGAAGPLIVLPRDADQPPRIWAAGGELSHRENVSRLRGFGRRVNGQFSAEEDVDYLPGCAILLRREAIDRVGLLDEDYFCYMEDVDLGQRIREAGFVNRLVPSAIAVHAASASTGGGYSAARKYMNAANSVRFLKRHPSLKGWCGFVAFDVVGWPFCLLNAVAHGRPDAAFAKLRGLLDGLRGRRVTATTVERYLRNTPR